MDAIPMNIGPPSANRDIIKPVIPQKMEQLRSGTARTRLWGDPKRSDPVTVHAHTGDPANEASLL